MEALAHCQACLSAPRFTVCTLATSVYTTPRAPAHVGGGTEHSAFYCSVTPPVSPVLSGDKESGLGRSIHVLGGQIKPQ